MPAKKAEPGSGRGAILPHQPSPAQAAANVAAGPTLIASVRLAAYSQRPHPLPYGMARTTCTTRTKRGHPMLKHLAALSATFSAALSTARPATALPASVAAATAAVLLSLASPVAASPVVAVNSTCAPPMLPERPELEHYQDYSAFIADIMTFKRLEAELHNNPAKCAPAEHDEPARHSENLGEAVASARQQPRFDYQRHATWYDRSTSQSFVLQRLNRSELADERLQAGPLAAQRLLPRAALVRLPPDWRQARHADDQALRRDHEARRVEASSDNAGLKLVQRNENLVLFYDHTSALVRVRGDVYVSSGRCVANCRIAE